MRIPQGNFGNVVAQPQRQAQVQQDNQVTNALGRVAQAGMQVASDLQQAEQQKQRSQAAAVLATMDNDAHDLNDEISRGLADGTVKPEEALPTYQKRFSERKKERTAGLAPEQMEVIESHLIRTNGSIERSLNGAVVKRTQQDTGANLTNISEQLQRAAMRDLPGATAQWDKIVDTMGPQAGMDPVAMANAKQRFKEGATFNFANATLEGAAQSGNIELVRAAREKIEGPDGEPLDPARRTALITKAYAYENGILAAGARDAEKVNRELEARENKARDALKDAEGLMLNGRYLSTDYLAQLADVTAGTSAAGAVQEIVKSQAEVAGFASLPLNQQAAVIERVQSRGSSAGVGTNPAEQKRLDAMQRIYDGGAKAYKENPWQAAQERGVIKDAPTFNVSNVQQAQQVLGERMQQIHQIEVAAGRKISPLQPQEAEQIGRLVRSLPPDQQSTALASFGQVIGDGDRLVDFARQIDAKDKVLGTAMMLAGQKTTQGRYASELVLKGERALRDKSIVVDDMKETGWRGTAATEIRGVYLNEEVASRMIDAAYFVQAGLTAEGSGNIKQAIKLVTGGIIERNGGKIPLPYGMDEDTFEKRVEAIKPEQIAAPGGQVFVGKTPVPVAQFVQSLPDASLQHAGNGKYLVRAGMGYVTKADGSKLVIEVRK